MAFRITVMMWNRLRSYGHETKHMFGDYGQDGSPDEEIPQSPTATAPACFDEYGVLTSQSP